MKDSIDIIIPAFNEENCIVDNINTIKRTLNDLQIDYSIIVIDDASEDDTALQLKGNDNIIYYRKVVGQGKGAAIRTGMKIAKLTGHKYVAFLDADLQVKLSELKTFFKIMHLYDADVVIGSKRHKYSTVRYPLSRRIVSVGYALMVAVLFRFPLRDTQCGFKLFKKDALLTVMDKILIKRYAFDIEMLVALKDNNFRIADAPIFMSRPIGKGSVSTGSIYHIAKDTLAVWWRRKNKYYEI